MTEMCELKKRFAAGGYTLMLTNGREYLTSFERGVSPLVKLLDSGRDLRGWSVRPSRRELGLCCNALRERSCNVALPRDGGQLR